MLEVPVHDRLHQVGFVGKCLHAGTGCLVRAEHIALCTATKTDQNNHYDNYKCMFLFY